MPPRVRITHQSISPSKPANAHICLACRRTYASLNVHATATATTPAPPPHEPTANNPIRLYPRNQPPSHKPPEFRKSQLHRQYQSLLRSSPLMLVFQHNNLKSTEWMAVRRELAAALRKVDEQLVEREGSTGEGAIADGIKIQVVQTGIFASAMRVVEFWDPNFSSSSSSSSSPSSSTTEELELPDSETNHGLSTIAHAAARRAHKKRKHNLEPLLTGPLAILTFPSVSPAHLRAVLTILSPSPAFPAPKRKTNPSYHEPSVQNGVQKLMLLAARAEGRVLDFEGARWVGGIEGGLDGLRGQLVAMLGGVAGGVTRTLEGLGVGVWATLEGRKGILEEEQKGGKEGEGTT